MRGSSHVEIVGKMVQVARDICMRLPEDTDHRKS